MKIRLYSFPRFTSKWLKLISDRLFKTQCLRDFSKRLIIPAFRIDFSPPGATPSSPTLSPRSPLANNITTLSVNADPQIGEEAAQSSSSWFPSINLNLQLPWSSRPTDSTVLEHSAVAEVFNNVQPGNFGNSELLSDVCMRSSAAPAYFPAFQGYYYAVFPFKSL